MPRAPKNETYEQKKARYLRSGYAQARTRKQNLNPDGTLKVTEDDLQLQAYNYMEKMLAKEDNREQLRSEIASRYSLEDEEYRKQQERRYRADYDWNTSNDEAALDHLLNLEIQIRQISRELEANAGDKDKLRKSLNDTNREHRQSMAALGIDRISREKKSNSGDPMDDWERIKEEAKIKKSQQRQKFLEQLPAVKTEQELKDLIKYGLLLKFDTIEPMLVAHRRVLGLQEDLDGS